MRVIGITGGIGAGKSTVAALYASHGVPVIDADAVSHALTAPQGEALPLIRDAFDDAVFRADGTLERAMLAKTVFVDDPAPRKQLNAILHPLITRRILADLARLRDAGEPAVLLDVPLLFESGMDRLCDAVLCVSAPESVRVQRLRGRDRMSAEEALRRIRSQNPQQRTESLSDYVLHTDAPIPDTRRRALALWQTIPADGPRRTPAQE